MSRKQVLGTGLVTFLVGFIITIVGTAGHTHGLAVGGAVVMVIGVIVSFYYLLATPKKVTK
jgi:Na+/melibiose symporter-like transporter